jgi:hypothetical protein
LSQVQILSTALLLKRSELHGFAAPVQYIHQLARYYLMRLKGEYEWECDSQCSLNRIAVLLKFEQRRRQLYNADIISYLTHRLGQNRSMNIKSAWVKAHQDEKKLPGQILSDAALRNLKADSIAEDYLLDPRQPQISENVEHVVLGVLSIANITQIIVEDHQPLFSVHYDKPCG